MAAFSADLIAVPTPERKEKIGALCSATTFDLAKLVTMAPRAAMVITSTSSALSRNDLT